MLPAIAYLRIVSSGELTGSDPRPWQVRIRDKDEHPVGAGLLLADGFVLTCAHVVGDDPSTKLLVDLPGVPDLRPSRAEVRRDSWYTTAGEDIAVLGLMDREFSDGWKAPLHHGPITSGERVVMCGYPRGGTSPQWIDGTLSGSCGPRDQWVLVNTDPHGLQERSGFSGAGVIHRFTGNVVGMVNSRGVDSAGLLCMIPIAVLADHVPELASTVHDGTMIDPVFAADHPSWADDVDLAKLLVDWCQGRTLDVLKIVTGHRDSSAFRTLRHVIVLADRLLRPSFPEELTSGRIEGTVPPAGTIDLAIDATGRSVEEIAARINARSEDGTQPINTVIDGVDSAASPNELVAKLIAPLTRQGGRLLLGFHSARGAEGLRIYSGATPLPSVGKAAGQWVGADLVPLPAVDFSDPARRVMDDPGVPENLRFCTDCGAALGRNKNGAEGICPHCAAPFSFVPQLEPGTLVENRYRIVGCLAKGGMGWVFLAEDTRLDNHHVVLKGLFSSRNERARKLAAAERRSLTNLNHPSIVRSIGFVVHPFPESESSMDYIVLEYVEGLSLRELTSQQGKIGPPLDNELSIEHVLAYGYEILNALEYLHGRGFLFCDIKPDNVIRRRDRITLIDLGGVRRVGDRVTQVVCTARYAIPNTEIHGYGWSVSADLFALGRTLDELFHSTVEGRRDRDRVKSNVDFGIQSFHRLVLRATSRDRQRRFQSAAEMAVQVRGVLREILSLRGRESRSEPSTLFTATPALLDAGLGKAPELRTWTARSRNRGAPDSFRPTSMEIAIGLPVPQVWPDDSAAHQLNELDGIDPQGRLHLLSRAPADSIGAQLCECRTRIELGDLEGAEECLANAEAALSDKQRYDWRLEWHRGLVALGSESVVDAQTHFDAVYAALPGEDIPKLALGLCAEHQGNRDRALLFYRAVWKRNRTQVSAAFGQARILLSRGKRWDAVDVLDEVSGKWGHVDVASIAAVRVLSARIDQADGFPGEREYDEVIKRAAALRIDRASQARLVAAIREVALEWIRRHPVASFHGGFLLGTPATERTIGSLLEESYRMLAWQASSERDHGTLIDLAYEVRPRTIL